MMFPPTKKKTMKPPPKKSQLGGHKSSNIRQPLDVFQNKLIKN
jgi:hypothetical protein